VAGFNKGIIVPIVSVICIAIKFTLGVDIDADLQAQITDVVFNTVLVCSVLYGIFKNYKKPVE
jgi:hypothetical protein